MEFTTSDLYEVLRSRRQRTEGWRDIKPLLGSILIALLLTAFLDVVGMALGLLLAGGAMIYLKRRQRREAQKDRDEAARLYAELPADLRAEEIQAGE